MTDAEKITLYDRVVQIIEDHLALETELTAAPAVAAVAIMSKFFRVSVPIRARVLRSDTERPGN